MSQQMDESPKDCQKYDQAIFHTKIEKYKII